MSMGMLNTKQKLTGNVSNKIVISPKQYDVVIFDMDGVVTRTAEIHSSAWKEVFDAYLLKRYGDAYKPFDVELDYHLYVDGKPRYEGVQSFLESRNINLPWGNLDDPSDRETIYGLGNRKNEVFQEIVREQGVTVYDSTIALIKTLKAIGIKTALITASKNAPEILKAANLSNVFDAQVDGNDALRLGLKGKPEPDVFLEAARQLNITPQLAIVVEDAIAGVQAGKKGGFGLVVGVDREHQSSLLRENGADVVVKDLSDVEISNQLRGVEAPIQPVNQQDWALVYEEYLPEKERQRESLCTLGNGYFMTRGAAPESDANEVHYPGTYLAGGYNRLKTEIAGRVLEHEDLVNMPNWLPLTFRIDGGEWFNLEAVQLLSYRQVLDLKQGVLYRYIRFQDKKDRITQLSERRLVHMRNCHLAGLETTITAENWSGKLEIRSALDGRVINSGVKGYHYLNKKHLQNLESSSDADILFLKVQTSQSELRVAQAARTQIFRNDIYLEEFERRTVETSDYVAQDLIVPVSQDDQIRIEKIVSLFTSRDDAISEAGLAARRAIMDAPKFQTLFESHVDAWTDLWERFSIDIEMAEEDTMHTNSLLILHLHSFHVLQTASPNSVDLDVGIPARGWTGEAYQGHVFWDDLFIFPFLNLRMPEITESLLKYRYKRLNEARKLAHEMGFRGARYPWQSGSSGEEETPKFFWDADKKQWLPDHTYLQVHVNSAIAYNVWQYYQVTGDIEFLYSYGAEIIFEIARFWTSIASYNPDLDRYEILGVVGPDEYHVAYPNIDKVGINNNAYTNMMAVWVLCRALEILQILPDDYCNELSNKLNLQCEEFSLWEHISQKMRIVFQGNGIISQFEGYEQLEEFPWRDEERIDLKKLKQILKEQGGQLNQYKVSKQADVLMLFYLLSYKELKELFDRLGYPFEEETIPKTIHYYLQQTAHGSTLSRVAHAWVVARGDRCHAWEFFTCTCLPDACNMTAHQKIHTSSWGLFLEALGSDFFDIQGGTTPEGIHLGAMVGTVDMVQRCYTGMVTRGDVLWLNPRLPEVLKKMSFNLHYRKQSLRFDITQDVLKISARRSSAKPIQVGFQNQTYELKAGDIKEWDIQTT
jgi:beta-phosphoglucomutase family hydrolase